jgi:hypothetical protein
VQEKLRETVSVKDFGAVGDGTTNDSTAFSLAINAISAAGGGTLYVPEGVYKITSKIYKTVSNITIRGDGMPWYNGSSTALVGGTIIQGTVHLIGDSITVESLGIDCGSDVCTSINSGVAMDALILMDPTRTIRYNCTVRDVITLCKEPTSTFHNFLLEGLSDSRFENLHAKNAQWGVVLKTQRSTADGLYAYDCSQAGLTIKSDTGVNGSPANHTTVSNVVINNDGYPAAATCILIYASTNDLYSCSLTNFATKNGVVGLKLLGDTRATYNNILNNIAISNGVIDSATTFGFESFGAVADICVSNLIVKDTVSNKSIKVWSDSLGISFDNVNASALNTADPLNVDLAGWFSFNNLNSLVGMNFATPSGINIAPDVRAYMNIGNYRGTLYSSGTLVSVTLTNGWTTYSGSTVKIDARCGQVRLNGRAQVPSIPWTGKEQIGTIPANLTPQSPKYFIGNAIDSSNVTIPVLIEVNAAGAISASFLNTVAAFPASVIWVGFDGIQWNLNE